MPSIQWPAPAICILFLSLWLCILAPPLRYYATTESQAWTGPRVSSLHPPYDFRSRIYSAQVAQLDYRVSWLGARKNGKTSENAAATWLLRVREQATFVVERISNVANHTLPTCPGGEHVVEKIHALLEGPAIVAPTGIREVDDARSAVNITAYDPGLYKLHVEAIFSCSTSNNNTIHPVRGSPFSVVVQGSPSFPRKRCVDYRFRHGRWMECHNTPLLCTRTGWVWVPSDCYSHVYSADEIINHDRPTWVVFAGTSVERGSFFALVDHLLGERAANLTHSEFWKCWGWMDLKVGNFRASYLDFRPFIDFRTDSNRQYRMTEIDYIKRAIRLFLDVARMDGRGPDLLHLELEFQIMNRELEPNELAYVGILKSFLGHTWPGSFVVSVGKAYSAFYATSKYPTTRFDIPGVYQELDRHPIPDVLVADETNLAAAAIHETVKVSQDESLPQGQWSFHYHRRCSFNGMHVCSPVCDAAMQQILNMAFGSYRPNASSKRYAEHEAGTRHRPHNFEFCLHCPKSLMPFTVADITARQCLAFLPASRNDVS